MSKTRDQFPATSRTWLALDDRQQQRPERPHSFVWALFVALLLVLFYMLFGL